MATIHDVARRAGVASVTVSRHLNASGPVSESVQARIEAAVLELGYVPNELARGLKSRSTRTLGLVVSDVSNPFFTSIARGIEDVAHAHGYSVILCNTDEDSAKQEQYLGVLRSRHVDGLILTPAGHELATISAWRRRCGPICIIDRTLPEGDHRALGIDCVRAESLTAAERLVSHLLGHGHRRVGLVNGPPDISTAQERRLGYRRALDRHGIPRDPRLEHHVPFKVEAGRAAALALLDSADPPTALFATNSFLTIGVLCALRERGRRVPEDMAVVGFDEIPQMALVAPFLTVARQPEAEIGQRAAQFLLERLGEERRPGKGGVGPTEVRKGRDEVLETSILLRRSCGCPGETR
jgi:LacI family transcriptional regulator, galactose operon repressor